MIQIKFKDNEANQIHGGILLDDGSIVCGCCGGLISADEIGPDKDHTIITKFKNWINLDEFILGDDVEERGDEMNEENS